MPRLNNKAAGAVLVLFLCSGAAALSGWWREQTDEEMYCPDTKRARELARRSGEEYLELFVLPNMERGARTEIRGVHYLKHCHFRIKALIKTYDEGVKKLDFTIVYDPDDNGEDDCLRASVINETHYR